MTRHGMLQPSAAGTQPPATDPRASLVIVDADKAATVVAPSRKFRVAKRRSGLSASIPAQPDGGRAIPDSSRNPKSP